MTIGSPHLIQRPDYAAPGGRTHAEPTAFRHRSANRFQAIAAKLSLSLTSDQHAVPAATSARTEADPAPPDRDAASRSDPDSAQESSDAHAKSAHDSTDQADAAGGRSPATPVNAVPMFQTAGVLAPITAQQLSQLVLSGEHAAAGPVKEHARSAMVRAEPAHPVARSSDAEAVPSSASQPEHAPPRITHEQPVPQPPPRAATPSAGATTVQPHSSNSDDSAPDNGDRHDAPRERDTARHASPSPAASTRPDADPAGSPALIALARLTAAASASTPRAVSLSAPAANSVMGVAARDHAGAAPARSALPPPAEPARYAHRAHASEVASIASRGLAAALRADHGSVTLRLNPGDLGPLRVQLTLGAGSVAADFEVETPAARDLLAASLQSLRAGLEARGLAVDDLRIHLAPDRNAEQPLSQQTREQHTHDQHATDPDTHGRHARHEHSPARDGAVTSHDEGAEAHPPTNSDLPDPNDTPRDSSDDDPPSASTRNAHPDTPRHHDPSPPDHHDSITRDSLNSPLDTEPWMAVSMIDTVA